MFYKSSATDTLAEKFPSLFGFLAFVKGSPDTAYDWYVAKVQQRFAMLLKFLEDMLLSGLIIRGFSGVVGLIGIGARALHVGNLHAYVYWFLFGSVLLWAYAAGWLF